MVDTTDEANDGKLASAIDKAANVFRAAGDGISQRPTAWTAIAIVFAFCARDVLLLWLRSGA